MQQANRRKNTRLKIDQVLRTSIQIQSATKSHKKLIQADSVNVSTGGMALKINVSGHEDHMDKGGKIKIVFRLPGHSLQECLGKITHVVNLNASKCIVGIKFTKIPKSFSEQVEQMTIENLACDDRIRTEKDPLCIPSCSFRQLCRKPIRTPGAILKNQEFEIAFQPLI